MLFCPDFLTSPPRITMHSRRITPGQSPAFPASTEKISTMLQQLVWGRTEINVNGTAAFARSQCWPPSQASQLGRCYRLAKHTQQFSGTTNLRLFQKSLYNRSGNQHLSLCQASEGQPRRSQWVRLTTPTPHTEEHGSATPTGKRNP